MRTKTYPKGEPFLSTPSARRATFSSSQYLTRVGGRFLSTPSARRATLDFAGDRPGHGNFYPRPPRGGRRCLVAMRWRRLPISIHALREEGDIFTPAMSSSIVISIHALREEGDRLSVYLLERRAEISIHALREEGDLPEQQLVAVDDVISIHALREEGDPFPIWPA